MGIVALYLKIVINRKIDTKDFVSDATDLLEDALFTAKFPAQLIGADVHLPMGGTMSVDVLEKTG